MTFEIEIQGRLRRVSVSAVGAARPGGGRFRVEVQDAGDDGPGGIEPHDVDVRLTQQGLSFVYRGDGRSVDAIVTPRARGSYVVDLPHASLAALVDRRRFRRGPATADSATGEQRILAPLPGRIVRVLVAVGQLVAPRQDLVVIEAMKMENALVSAHAGRVRDVVVTDGMSVDAGRLLLVLDPLA